MADLQNNSVAKSSSGGDHRATPQDGRIVDIACGIVIPSLVILLNLWGSRSPYWMPSFGRDTAGMASAILLSVISLIYWRFARRPSAALAGLLTGSALYIAAVGVVWILPLIPAYVYLRNALPIFLASPKSGRIAVFALTATFAGSLPYYAQMHVAREVQRAIYLALSEGKQDEAAAIFKKYRWVDDLDDVIDPYLSSKDNFKVTLGGTRLNEAYKQVTGIDIEHRMNYLIQF